MAIDPNIALNVRPIEQPNMLGQMAQVMAMRQAQQEYENEGGLRNALKQGMPDDPSSLLKYGKSGRAVYESTLKGKKEQLESSQKRIDMMGGLAGFVRERPTPENFVSSLDQAVSYGLMTPAQKQATIAQYGGSPESIRAYADQTFQSALTAKDRTANETRLESSRISAAPGHRQASVAEQKWAEEQKRQAEIDAISGGGTTTPAPSTSPMTFSGGGGGGGSGAGAGSSIMVNPQRPNALIQGTTPALSPNMLRPDAQAQPPVAAPTIAPPADIYERIDAIDREIAKYPINNPRSIPILQQLNQQRTQLLASAKQEFGGDVIDMTVPNPAKPGTFITVKGRRDQRGVYQPVQMGETPILYDLKPNSTSESISPGVARPAPRVGYKYNEAGEEVKIPQTGVPEGVRIKPGERWSEEKQMVEQIPGSAAFIEQQTKHGKDLGAIKTVQTTTKWGKDRIDTILDPKNKAGFENNFGGFSAYATKEFSGDTARVKSELDSLKSDLKERGLQLFRSGGSIGAMTEKEWPIVENMIASLNPRLDADDARDILRKIKVKFDNIESLAAEKYNDQWQNTQYHKPVETNRNAPASGGGIDTSNKFLQQ